MLRNKQSFQSLIQKCINNINPRFFSTRGKRGNQTSLYSIISPLGNPNLNITPELESWVKSGNKVRFAELQRIIRDLRKRKRFPQALQVCEWMKSSGTYTFTPVEHAVQLDLIGKVHGFVSAESYFDSLSEQDKTDKVYGALLHCYVRQRETDKALAHFNVMKEKKGLALTSVAFNDIMSLYSNTGENVKIPDVFNQMRENGVKPDNLSYRICINSYGVRSDIEGVERVLNEMENDSHVVMDWNTYAVVANLYIKADLKCKANIVLKKAEKGLDGKDSLGYNHLISLHARMGNKDDVLRLWCLEKDACKKCFNRDYINIMESLMRLDELEEAEKVFKEWEASGNCYDFRVPNVVISGYIEKGLCERGEELLEGLIGMDKASNSVVWARLAAGYLEKGDIGKALQSLRTAITYEGYQQKHDGTKSVTIEDNLFTKILRLVGEKGGVDDVEKVVNLLRSVVPLKKQMYHALLKSCVTSGREVDVLLHIMKEDNYEADRETLDILSLKQDDTITERVDDSVSSV